MKIRHISKRWIIAFAIVGAILFCVGIPFMFSDTPMVCIISLLGIYLCSVAYILNNHNKRNENSKENRQITKGKDHHDVNPQDKVDYKALHDEMYYVEYKLIPHFVEMFKEQPEKASQIVVTIYENLVTLQNRLREVNPFAFGNISCEVCGNIANECLVVYVFPKPFDMPLAKYGAIYLNKSQKEYTYWTLEFSMNGKYVLGSMTTEGHANYGQRADMSKEEFIHELCQGIGIEESALQPRNRICRKYMVELNDHNIENVKAYPPLSVVCFYDFNQPSQTMITVLDHLAQEYQGQIIVGLYDVYGGIDNLSAPAKYSVSVLPTILFFAKGELIDERIGMCGTEMLKAKFKDLLERI